MFTLDGTNQTLKAYLDATYGADVVVFVDYSVETETSSTISGRVHRQQVTSVNGTTPVVILSAPPSGSVYAVLGVALLQPNSDETRVKISKFVASAEKPWIDLSLAQRDHVSVGD